MKGMRLFNVVAGMALMPVVFVDEATRRGDAASETRKFGYAPKRTGGRIRTEHVHQDDGRRPNGLSRQVHRRLEREAAKKERAKQMRQWVGTH